MILPIQECVLTRGERSTGMAERVLAAVRTGPGKTELREFPMPDIHEDAALLQVEVAGICGTDVKMYARPPFADPVIMGHENTGVIAKAGPKFVERHGVDEGERVFVEHYVPCCRCEWCRAGEYRHCKATDWRTNPDARRYGYTSAVLVQGPGQQGLSQVVACKPAGASLIIVTGTSRDAARLELARTLGADQVLDVQKEDPLPRILELTGGEGVDAVLDCTAGAGVTPILFGIDALKRRGGILLVQGELAAFPDFPLRKLTEKAITIKSARGHSYRACELALEQLASKRFPLDLLTTNTFGLDEVDRAIRTVGGEGDDGAIHVSLLPWKHDGG